MIDWIHSALKQWDEQIEGLIQEYFPDATLEMFYSEDQQCCLVEVRVRPLFNFVLRYPQVAAGFIDCPIWVYLDGNAFYLDPFLYPEMKEALKLISTQDKDALRAAMRKHHESERGMEYA